MGKSKKSARKRTNWKLFLRLCQEGKSNEQIAKSMDWKIDAKSGDPTKRVRAAKSAARTKGIKVEGKVVRLRDSKLKGTVKLKPSPPKKASKPKSQPKPKTSLQSAAPANQAVLGSETTQQN